MFNCCFTVGYAVHVALKLWHKPHRNLLFHTSISFKFHSSFKRLLLFLMKVRKKEKKQLLHRLPQLFIVQLRELAPGNRDIRCIHALKVELLLQEILQRAQAQADTFIN